MLNKKKLLYLAGNENIKNVAREPFSKITIDFLDDLSKKIFKNKNSTQFKDLMTFAFWCRKNNIRNYKNKFKTNKLRFGIGLIFHIPPSNVPISFIYSFVFGILSGNSNIVRLSKPDLEQNKLLIKIINELLRVKKYKELYNCNIFLSYDKDDFFTNHFSKIVDGRIIWGSDKTISEFKKKETKLNCVDLFFGDKYSICFLNSKKIKKLKSEALNNLVKNFYNDSFIMDQNACSSPHLILWDKNAKIQDKKVFWNTLEKYVVKNFHINNSIVSKKYKLLNDYLFSKTNLKLNKFNNQYIININLNKLTNKVYEQRGFSGIFFEYNLKKYSEFEKILSRRFQTLTYFGYDKNYFINLFKNKNYKGIDRIVPVGNALQIDLVWDGIDVINNLTRIIDIK